MAAQRFLTGLLTGLLTGRRLLMALALAIPATGVSAATITQNFLLGPAGSLTAAGFDSSLGTLNSVTFSIGGSVTYDWSASGAGDVDTFLDLFLSADLSGGGFALVDMYTFYDFRLIFDFLGEDDSRGGSETLSALSGGQYFDPEVVALFLASAGEPTMTYDFSVSDDPSFNSVPDFQGRFGPISGSASLVYDYTPSIGGVPEPASWALMIIGFGLVGAAQRRRSGETPVTL